MAQARKNLWLRVLIAVLLLVGAIAPGTINYLRQTWQFKYEAELNFERDRIMSIAGLSNDTTVFLATDGGRGGTVIELEGRAEAGAFGMSLFPIKSLGREKPAGFSAKYVVELRDAERKLLLTETVGDGAMEVDGFYYTTVRPGVYFDQEIARARYLQKLMAHSAADPAIRPTTLP